MALWLLCLVLLFDTNKSTEEKKSRWLGVPLTKSWLAVLKSSPLKRLLTRKEDDDVVLAWALSMGVVAVRRAVQQQEFEGSRVTLVSCLDRATTLLFLGGKGGRRGFNFSREFANRSEVGFLLQKNHLKKVPLFFCVYSSGDQCVAFFL